MNSETNIMNTPSSKKGKPRYILMAVAALIVIVLPFVAVIGMVVGLPSQYDAVYHGALDEKYKLLRSYDEDKIVVIGGSSVAFGLDSELLSEYTGMPVVNFGLYAALGTKVMLDLSRSGINKGDIVILAPEINPESLSMYFNSDTTLQAIDGKYSMFWDVETDNKLSLLGAMWSFLGDKWDRFINDDPALESGYYASRYFDKNTGDYDYRRPANAMMALGYFDPENPIYLSVDSLEDNTDSYDFDAFADYLNDYIHDLERRGATVYFSWCPMNELSLAVKGVERPNDKAGDDEIAEYNTMLAAEKLELVEFLKEKIDCTFIGDIDDYIMDAGYFFDTNLHLNMVGVKARTTQLADDLRYASDKLNYVVRAEDIPTAPYLEPIDMEFDGYDENSVYFTYEVDRYTGGYIISGLSELGRQMESLTVPAGYLGIKVTKIAEGALDDSSRLRTLIIPADSNIVQLMGNTFGGSSIGDLWIYKGPSDVMPPTAVVGVADGFEIHVPPSADDSYSSHYYWGELKDSKGNKFPYVEDAISPDE